MNDKEVNEAEEIYKTVALSRIAAMIKRHSICRSEIIALFPGQPV